MIDRYSTDIAKIWKDNFKFKEMARLELIYLNHFLKKPVHLSDVKSKILKEDNDQYWDNVTNTIRIFEKETKHETAAVIKWLKSVLDAYHIPKEQSKYLHYDLTSSDILDTVYSYQLDYSKAIIQFSLNTLISELKSKARINKVNFIGRTHGKWAQERNLSSFFLEHLAEFEKIQDNLISIDVKYGKLSGPVGNPDPTKNMILHFPVLSEYFDNTPNVPECTQVIPRHLYIPFFNELKNVANAIERLATNIRNLSRSEIGEMDEGFSEGQIGSSAMPHKKNPILCENLCGISRVIRSYNAILDQSTCLWNERDMSHSSVERIVVPDMIILADFAINRMIEVIKNLHISYERIEANRQNAKNESQSVKDLNDLISSGLSREEAYKKVQEKYKRENKNDKI